MSGSLRERERRSVGECGVSKDAGNVAMIRLLGQPNHGHARGGGQGAMPVDGKPGDIKGSLQRATGLRERQWFVHRIRAVSM